MSVSINPQGTQMTVAGEDGFVQTYPIPDLSLDDLMQRGCEWLKYYFAIGKPERQALDLCE